jgi:L-alanine-DL-glutamate epimerase-like enolase superfamily enzyme
MITIEARPLQIPLRLRHKQASSDRSCGDSIWVEARRGTTLGVGEGCPRDYVTGERTHSSLAWLATLIPELTAKVGELDSLREFILEHEAEIDRHPAAWCAVELALLDLFAREASLSVERLLQIREHPSCFRYTAVLSDVELERSRALVARAVAAELREFKLKLSGDLTRDRERLALVHAAVEHPRIRLDANNLWGDRVDDALRHLAALGPFDAVEEPLRPRHAAGLARLGRELGVAVIVDESLCRIADFALLDQHPAAWIANLKVSKCGGLLRAIAMAEAARQRGIPVLIGAQVGETSILTRAGIVLARAAGAVASMEGGAGLLLLEYEPVTPVLQMGHRGEVDLDKIDCGSHGLGLSLVRCHDVVPPDSPAG